MHSVTGTTFRVDNRPRRGLITLCVRTRFHEREPCEETSFREMRGGGSCPRAEGMARRGDESSRSDDEEEGDSEEEERERDRDPVGDILRIGVRTVHRMMSFEGIGIERRTEMAMGRHAGIALRSVLSGEQEARGRYREIANDEDGRDAPSHAFSILSSGSRCRARDRTGKRVERPPSAAPRMSGLARASQRVDFSVGCVRVHSRKDIVCSPSTSSSSVTVSPKAISP